MTPLEITLLILVLTIVAFITGKIPFSVISAGIMLSLIMTGVMEPAEAFSGFINMRTAYASKILTQLTKKSHKIKIKKISRVHMYYCIHLTILAVCELAI